MTKQRITFKPSTPYSQKENGILEKIRRTIINIMRATILEWGIDNILWPKIVLTMTYIKNFRLTQALKEFISPIRIQNQAALDLYHLCILGSNVYIFFHKKKHSLKSAKWEAHTLKRKLIAFDSHTIYCVYIKDQNKVIWVKNL